MCVDGMGTSDLAMNRLIPVPSQWPEFFAWARAAFDLTDDSWNGAGASEPWRGSLPYGKMINSIFLLAYALRDEYIPQWHARDDYLNAALAADNRYHGPFYTRFINDPNAEASSDTGRFLARDRINFKCGVFDFGRTSDTPANRAGVMVHEGWHHWQYKYGWETSHQTGGAIDPILGEGDWYYRHGSGYFDFGTLWGYNTTVTPIRFHSPYQVHVEYLADLAEFPDTRFIPVAVTDEARSMGNNRLARQFKNTVSYRIGQPRPF
ncbi:hypothetical protein [Arthrobacter sp. UYEF20]|uniref:hypothetical protein n=1 Tax=Arthrobacter sp. UYEF20 TaxID=1756363 RepID=UPI003390A9A1